MAAVMPSLPLLLGGNGSGNARGGKGGRRRGGGGGDDDLPCSPCGPGGVSGASGGSPAVGGSGHGSVAATDVSRLPLAWRELAAAAAEAAAGGGSGAGAAAAGAAVDPLSPGLLYRAPAPLEEEDTPRRRSSLRKARTEAAKAHAVGLYKWNAADP